MLTARLRDPKKTAWPAAGYMLLIITTAGTHWGCDKLETSTPNATTHSTNDDKLAEQKANDAFQKLKQLHHADDTWRELLKQNYVWTADLQRNLMDATRPIAGIGILRDVELNKGLSILHFIQPFDMAQVINTRATLEFRLSCNSQTAIRKPPEILSDLYTRGFGPATHAFVARIYSVKRYDELVAGRPDEDNNIYSIQVRELPHYIVNGECLALEYIGR